MAIMEDPVRSLSSEIASMIPALYDIVVVKNSELIKVQLKLV